MIKQVCPVVIADYREVRSGIPRLLCEKGCETEVVELKVGDYLINGRIIIERKSKEDFVMSLIQNRLFGQCRKLRKSKYFPGMLIEGNPYKTNHDVTREAIRGALLSVSISWQIPINYSSGYEDTVDLLMMMAQQDQKEQFVTRRQGYKPKSMRNGRLYFLQGLPLVGPKIARDLLKHFGSARKVIQAGEAELVKVSGIGKERAERIRRFLEGG